MDRFEAYAEQIKPVETKLLYENFLLMSLELQDERFQEDIKELNGEKLRCEISRKLAKYTLGEIVNSCPDPQTANFVFARGFGLLNYIFVMKGEHFLNYNNSLPEYVFEICCEMPMHWEGEEAYGFFTFNLMVLQKRIDAEVGCENADPFTSE
ncbi:MAG: hypothetical protein HRU10_11775 [Opitutales bacterium]|nr:hypothetical protein [Opitutales bacterium]